MTIDGENSVYVGGFPYDCSEDELRHTFELYGAVVAVKIINDRGMGGNCYGFVTFTNPRSAVDAIDDMNGRTIRGRPVTVNEVRTRGSFGRSNHGRESLQTRSSRNVDRRRRQDREMDYENFRDQFRDHSREQERGRERVYEHGQDDGRSRGYVQDGDYEQGRDTEEQHEPVHSRNRDGERERDDSLDLDQGKYADRDDGRDKRGDKEKEPRARRRSRSSSYDLWRSRELSSESDDYRHELEEELGSLIQRHEEVNGEKLELEGRLEERKQHLIDLQKRSKKLEEVLTCSKKLSSIRQMQLTKLQKSFLLVKEYGERLKASEKDLQVIAESLMVEINGDERVAS